MREKKRREKQKGMNKRMKGKSGQRKQWWKKHGKCWKQTRKRDGTETKNEDFLADFFSGFKCREREELIQNSKIVEK